MKRIPFILGLLVWASTAIAQVGPGPMPFPPAGTQGGVPWYSTAGSFGSSAALTANNPVLGGGTLSPPFSGTRSGNTTKFGTVNGTLTSGDCLKIDASGNLVDAGGACTTGGGSIAAAATNNLAVYTSSTAIGGLVTGTGVNTALGLSVTGSGGLVLATSPSITTPSIIETVGLSALTLTGATQTVSHPVINATQTWNNGATTFTGIFLNVTASAFAGSSLLFDLQKSTVSKFNVDTNGYITSQGGLYLNATSGLQNLNAYFLQRATGNWQFGNTDAAAPVAQLLTMQSVVAGTSNTAGTNFTLQASAGTGTGIGGSLIFQVAPAGSTGTTQNTWATALTIDSTKLAAFTGSVTIATALGAPSGGTGQGSYAIGDLLYASASNALSRLADVATGSLLTSGGVGVAPSWSASPTLTTSLTTPLLLGGTGAASALTLQSTSGAGTTDSIVMKVGNAGAVTALTVNTSGAAAFGNAVTSKHATAGIGYATGAGGTVTQATSKATTVTLNTVTGQITMNASALAAGGAVSFALSNTSIAITDLVVINHISGGTASSYVFSSFNGAGGTVITVRNITAGSLSEAIVLQFAVIKAVTS